jgi:hypothetical protein
VYEGPGRRRGVSREQAECSSKPVWEVSMNTRTIAIVALIIAVIVLILLLM